MTDTPKLTKRLSVAASYARSGAFLADIGTDHAYIPIYLFKKGKIRGAVASDINEGPLMRARANLLRYKADGGITLNLSNGLDGIEKFSPDDILILGMGGELICDIISRAEFTKNKNIRLILQPMTHPEILRSFLSENGYSITDEAIIEEDKIYQVMVATYTGESCSLSPMELLFGRLNLSQGGEALVSLLKHQREILEARQRGRQSATANADNPYEDLLLSEINKKLTDLTKEI
jgi:tRNA (adenine22-N1)-methyltransferase